MKNIFKLFGIIAIVAIIGFTMIACNKSSGSSSGGGGGKTLNSPEALKEYLDSQPANSSDKPIKVSMGANELMLPKIKDVLNSAGKYVSLNLTGNALIEIPSEAFEECKTLAGITIPNSVISIGYAAFSNCTSLTSVIIPNSVTTIGQSAFESCNSLANITIPNSVISINSNAFDRTAWFKNQPDGLLYIGKVAYKYKGTMPSNTNITLLDGTKQIAVDAFNGCTGLTSITIPDSVTSIGHFAFDGCTSLTSIKIPNRVTSINTGAFRGCTSLASITITIPSSITSIGDWAFEDCTSLTSITIPDSVTSIGVETFKDCTSLTSITFQGTIASDNLGKDGYYEWNSPFLGNLREKYLAGGIGTYTTTAPVNKYPKWTKQ